MTTLFARIIKGELPCEKVFENDYLFCFNDIHPVAPVHILIVPKKEIISLQSLAEEDFSLMGEIVKVVQQLAREYDIVDGYRLLTNSGAKAGQSVFHLHFHLLGGKTLQHSLG